MLQPRALIATADRDMRKALSVAPEEMGLTTVALSSGAAALMRGDPAGVVLGRAVG